MNSYNVIFGYALVEGQSLICKHKIFSDEYSFFIAQRCKNYFHVMIYKFESPIGIFLFGTSLEGNDPIMEQTLLNCMKNEKDIIPYISSGFKTHMYLISGKPPLDVESVDEEMTEAFFSNNYVH